MNPSKLLLSLMVALSVGTAAAQSNVTIYGTADVSVQGQNTMQGSARAGGPEGGVTAIKSNGSLLGFKGTEDLGNGNKALFQVETQVNMTGANGNQANIATQGQAFNYMRDSFLGLSSKYGTVLGGYNSTPYRNTLLSFDVFPGDSSDATILNVFGRTYTGAGGSQSAGTAGYAANQTAAFRATSIAYAMPTLYGINGSIAYTGNGGNNGTNNQINGTVSGDIYTALVAPNSALGFNLGWTGYGVNVTGAYQNAGYTNSTSSNVSSLQNTQNYTIGAQYTGITGLKVGALYGRNTINTNQTATTTAAKGASNSLWVGASYRFGNNEPRVSYALTSNTSGLANSSQFGSQNGGNQWNLGWGYYLSKRTQVYGLVSGIHNNANGVYNFYNATGGANNNLTGGQQLVTYGVGLRSNF